MRIDGKRTIEVQAELQFRTFLEQVLPRLEDPEAGCVKQALGEGLDSLSDKQEYHVQQVADRYHVDECWRCLESIQWDDMLNAHDRGGLCARCEAKLAPDS